MKKTLFECYLITIGVLLFIVGVCLLALDNPYAASYAWYEWIMYFFNSISFIAIGLYLINRNV